MATIPTSILLDPTLGDALKVVLMTMSTVADHDGFLTVSQAELGRRLGVSRQAMCAHMQEGVEAGLIEHVGATWRVRWIAAMCQAGVDNRNPGLTPDRQPQLDTVNSGLTSSRARVKSPTTTTSTKSLVVPLTDLERDKVRERYLGKPFPSVQLEEQIDLALSHPAAKKYPTNQIGYVMNWMRRTAQERREHEARMATEQARLERARTPYGGAVTEPTLKFRNIRDVVGQPSEEHLENARFAS
jgi:hypothetical protein